MPTLEKEETINELRTVLQASKGAILTDYRGLSVADLTDLRKKPPALHPIRVGAGNFLSR